MLQRFWGSLNWIADFYKDWAKICSFLYDKLKRKPSTWPTAHTQAIQRIKLKLVKELPGLNIPRPQAYKRILHIWKASTSDIRCGGILKQRMDKNNKDSRFTFGIWNQPRKNILLLKETFSYTNWLKKFELILNQVC